jgi:type III pantothenate kinase
MTADELEVAFGGLLGRYAERVSGVAALSTVPGVLRELRLLLTGAATRPSSSGPACGPGCRCSSTTRARSGADRVMNTLAAHRLHGTACVVVDFGTSTNIDVVSAKGRVPRRRARPRASRSRWTRWPAGPRRCAASRSSRPAR